MLVRDGHLTPAQIDLAIARQRTEGGRFGSILVEMGFVDLETITMYLGLELSLPVATGAALDRAKRTAVRLLTPEQAARHRCVPILISERQLIAAVDDPHDMRTLEAISKLTGYRVIPRVAPEIRIYYYLERYYGVPRPQRYQVLGDSPRGERRPAPKPRGAPPLPGPSLPGLPPRAENPVAAPTPAPVLRASSPTPEGTPPKGVALDDIPILTPEEIGAIEDEADALVVELEADAAETAEEAPPAEAFDAIETTREVKRPEAFAPLDAAEALTAMREAMQRGEVADAIMNHARAMFDVATLFIVRDNLAFGWKGFGPDVDSERLEALLVPLDVASVFQTAVQSERLFYAGNVFPSEIHRYLYKVLRCAPPKQAVIGAVTIGKRIVNILYGHKAGKTPLDADQLADLETLISEAAAAYVRLIAVTKKGKKARTATADPDADADADADTEKMAAVDAAAAAPPKTKPKKSKKKTRRSKKKPP
jgi:hypothetical protein